MVYTKNKKYLYFWTQWLSALCILWLCFRYTAHLYGGKVGNGWIILSRTGQGVGVEKWDLGGNVWINSGVSKKSKGFPRHNRSTGRKPWQMDQDWKRLGGLSNWTRETWKSRTIRLIADCTDLRNDVSHDEFGPNGRRTNYRPFQSTNRPGDWQAPS